ncbi:SDR family NAD(P)-dependent oxidoreductase [Actinomadura geliboluensis]|uniref:SDR family NAD(P)-dependent oxidoreductase n=1 Tax=Actinomadura geliboluensis TaxID=882440 RepID=UPI0036CC4B3C
MFVLFSSAAGVLGGPGQGNYAAANAFLDALAQHRRAHGLAATSLAWGWWEQDSALTGQMGRTDRARLARRGFDPMPAEKALRLFDRARGMEEAFFVVARFNGDRLREEEQQRTLPPALRSLFAKDARPVRRRAADVQTHGGGSAFGERLLRLPAERRPEMVLDAVRSHAAAVLGFAGGEEVGTERAFRDAGFDSLTGVELRNRLAALTGLRLPATLVFDHPTPAALAEMLCRELVGDDPVPAAVAAVERVVGEPVAIVGMGGRFPGGVTGPEELWELVAEGRDAVSAFPVDRGWDLEGLYDPDPAVEGRCYTREGGFLYGAGEFDAGFFGISPREALAMDPQQRLLLETAWEAVERAGIDPSTLKGTPTGTFIGLIDSNYATETGRLPRGVEGFVSAGNAASVASGRLAYSLGLEGPAVTVDTACSSSLVALHLAAQSLRNGECELALAGGAMVMPTPGVFVGFSRQRALAADGRCKAFSASADGFGAAEGVGVLVLERLSDARRNGHEVLAVIRGSAVNQDGASNGLTAPNGPSQQRVIRQALANAGLAPGDVDAVEAHGTGTALGDPIEAQALLATYGREHDEQRPLWLGSVKSNIGHTQAAAGVAGVMKMVMAMRNGVLPRTLHADEPSPHIDWSSGTVRLLTEPVRWEAGDHPRRAAVSSFGISGTNAHLVLEQAPDPSGDAANEPGGAAPDVVPLPVSGRSEAALAAQAGRLRTFLERDEQAALSDVGWSLAASRTSHGHRGVVLARDRASALAGLRALAEGEPASNTVTGTVRQGRHAVVFSGQGAQRPGMGRGLYAAFPAFAAAFDQTCTHLDERLRGHVPHPVKDVVFASAEDERAAWLDQTVYTQTGLFAFETALYRLLESFGIRADVVAGHSIGEITAAHVAGALSLADACTLVAARARLMQALPAGGAMASIRAAADVVADVVADVAAEEVSIAAINGSASTVVSGERAAVERVVAVMEERGAEARRLRVSHAFHSPLMDPMLDDFAAAIADLDFRPPGIPLISNITGRPVETLHDPAYWVEHVRSPVRFADMIGWMAGDQTAVCIEAGPRGALTAMAQDCLPEPGGMLLVPASRADGDETEALWTAIARAHAAGVALDWASVFADARPRRIDLPTYAFQRKRYWLDASSDRGGDARPFGLGASDHPLLGASVRVAADGGRLLTGRLGLQDHPWLADHVMAGNAVVPGAALLEMAMFAGDEAGCDLVEELTLRQPLTLPERGRVLLQVHVGAPDDSGRSEVTVHSREDGDDAEGPWTLHATATLTRRGVGEPGGDAAVRSEVWPPAGAEPVALDGFYPLLADAGYAYGDAFQGLRAAWRRGGDLYAEVALPRDRHEDASRFGIHPALLDAALHVALLDVAAASGEKGRVRLPFAYGGVRLLASGATTLRVRVLDDGTGTLSADLADAAGRPVAAIGSLVTRAVTADRLTGRAAPGPESLFALAWRPLGGPQSPPPAEGWAVIDARTADAALDAVAARPSAPAGVMLGPPAAPSVTATAEDVREHVTSTLRLLQRWLDDDRWSGTPLAITTRGAVAVEPGDEITDLAQSAVWGLVRSAQAENPGRFVLVDLPADGTEPEQVLGPVTAALDDGEPQIAVRGGVPLVPRLTRERPPRETAAARPDEHGTVLVTGGTGALGSALARHLVTAHGVEHLVLAGRRGADAPGAAALQAELEELGATVTIAACDVADRDDLTRLLAAIPAAVPLTGVVHTAGVVRDGVVTSMTHDQVADVLRPKVDAALNLHDLTRDLDLNMFVLYSSASGVLGNAGQGNYAAANAFLDALAHHRGFVGLPAVSLAWGMWDMAGDIGGHLGQVDRARLSRLGIRPLSVRQGLELFDAALGDGRPSLVPMRIDTARLRDQAGTAGLLPPLRGLAPAARRPVAAGRETDGASDLARRLAGLPEKEKSDVVGRLVRTHVAAVLGHPSIDAVSFEQPFTDLGFDSLISVELRNQLGAASGVRLAATAVFDHPTPAALARHLLHEILGTADDRTAPAVPAAAATGEPIAIIGMACRYPGRVTTPEEFWRLIAAGGDGISPFPDDRGWDLARLHGPDADQPGTSHVREGGFLYDAADFDPEFFDISPREALAMDPQQRLMLETSWEVLERAGIDPTALKGSATGVFAGLMYHDYAPPLERLPKDVEGYSGIGTAGSVLSGRVAYALGLEGPAVTVDTACSSSLVALHLAAQALRNGECSLALAGGVTVMATPGTFVEFARQGGLARDGRCKAFSAAADGTGWAEGVGVLLVERLSDAVRNGREVLAVVRGSAVNQDGASNGLTAPNGPSQQRVIRQALASAGLSASDVDAVEAHGTGTTLGDPIEAQALIATYGQDRDPERPLWLGSVKSNIGHAQAAAGVAGVIKMVMAMRNGMLPRTLHVDEPSPHIDWSQGTVRLLTEAITWDGTERPRRAGVSSFGISGTNAHVVLEQAPETDVAEQDRSAVPGGVVPLVVSGRSAEALAAQAARLREFLVGDDAPALPDVGRALAASRASLEHRGAVLAPDRETALAGLEALVRGEPTATVVSGVANPGRVVMVFPGQGSQWAGMGRELLDASPVFAEAVGECEAALAPHVDWSLVGVLRGGSVPERVDVVQPVLFAVMVGLARLWSAAGVVPDVVVGHSQGEIAAAHVAGALSLGDAAKVVALRSRALLELSGGGAMAQLALDEDRARRLLGSLGDRVWVAAVNGPAATVVSGEAAAVEGVLDRAREEGVWARRIPVDYASHSPQVGGVRERLLTELADIAPETGHIAFHSTVTGEPVDTTGLDAGYWYRNLREPVRFAEVVSGLVEQGVGVFVEVSAHPVLAAGIQDCGEAVGVVETLRRGDGGLGRFWASVAAAYVRGVVVDWAGLFGAGVSRVGLPTYAFQRRRFWLASGSGGAGDVGVLGLGGVGHPLLGAAVEVAGGDEWLLTGRLSVAGQSWLADHRVGGVVVVPGAAVLEMVVRAGDQVGCDLVEELTLNAPLVLGEREAVRVQLRVGAPDAEGRREVTVHSRTDGEDSSGPSTWSRHATGTLAVAESTRLGDVEAWTQLQVWPPDDADPLDVNGFYELTTRAGYEYGPAFQGLRAAWRSEDALFADVAPAIDQGPGFGMHPALSDTALHVSLLNADEDLEKTWLPFSYRGVRLLAAGASELRVRISGSRGDGMRIHMADPAGRPVAVIESMSSRPGAPHRPAVREPEALYTVDWRELPSGPVPHPANLDLWRAPRPHGPQSASLEALNVLQTWSGDSDADASRLVVVTCGAVSVFEGEDVADVGAAGVWGLVRSAQAEQPGRFVLVDVDDDGLDDQAVEELVASAVEAGESEVAVRGGAVFVPRLVRFDAGLPSPSGGGAWRLEKAGSRESLEDLALTEFPAADAPLEAGEVRVEVRAAGLNFRDVLIALGVYPGAAVMGGEIAGVVTDVGPGVEGLVVGDRVMGLVEGGFGPVAVTDHRMVVRVPQGWSFERAASVPTVFLTAWYGLRDLAGLKAGETVLVHAAAGGVGMAALQLARLWGAEVYATASPVKWDVVREGGVRADRIASSRDVEFGGAFAGAGVDVVLNSLTGEFIDTSLGLLSAGGRFVEMGKTDIRDPEEVDRDHPGITYRAFDLIEAGPARIGEMLAEIVELLERGLLRPLPVRTWDIRRAGEAFRYMSRARHVGKIVLTLPPVPDPDGTVLVTGGTGTLGALVARHLATVHRVRHLTLTSRRGLDAPGASELRAQLEELGVHVQVVACDVGDREQLAAVLEGLPAPLTGVVHAAGVLDDGLIGDLTSDRIAGVWGPKAEGAWHLHELTRGLDLGMFVLFSSAAGVLGGPGQGNYAAANAFLDALAQHRRAHGLPATSLAWGQWEQDSALTGQMGRADRARLVRRGFDPLPSRDALRLFDLAHNADRPLLVPVQPDSARLHEQEEQRMLPPILRDLVAAHGRPVRRRAADGGTRDHGSGLRRRLAALPADQGLDVVVDLVRTKAATILGHAAPAAIDIGRGFLELGFDSLTAVELRNMLNAATGLRLPSTLVFDHPTPASLAELLYARIGPERQNGASVTDGLDRLERLIVAAAPDAEERASIVRRLRAFAQRLDAVDEPDGTDLSTVTDDEMFSLIDKELGLD